MTERTQMKTRIRRRPRRDLDVADEAAVREGIVHDITGHFTLSGGIQPLARFFGPGWEEQMELAAELDEGGREEAVAALFLYLSAREGVALRYREGEVILDRRRVLGLLQVTDPSTLAWRLHQVRVGEGDAGCGVFVGDWTESAGVGLDALPEPFREGLDVGKASVSDFHTEAKPTGPPKPYLRTAVLTVNGEVPPGAQGLAQLVGLATDAEMLRGPQQAALVFVLRGTTLERWEVHGELPCSLDDFIRAAVIHSKGEGAALVHPGTVTFQDEPTRRAVIVMAQRDGQLCRRILPLTFADDGTTGALNPVLQEGGPPEAPWIGVAPAEGVAVSWELAKPVHGGVLAEG